MEEEVDWKKVVRPLLNELLEDEDLSTLSFYKRLCVVEFCVKHGGRPNNRMNTDKKGGSQN